MGPLNALITGQNNTVVFLRNYHWFMKPGVIQKIQNNLDKWKGSKKAIVVISPNSEIPPELESGQIEGRPA